MEREESERSTATATTTIRIGVVPEHFSIPFHLGKEHGIFEKHGIRLDIEEFPRGTGSMCRSLRQKEIDVAVALTEGIIADIAANDNDIQLIATYVQSPLHWGIWVHPESNFATISDLKQKTFGISRLGSGSHLMVSLLAFERNWDIDTDVKFEVKGGLQDLLHGIQDRSTDAFLWEKFTTKHSEEQNLVRFLGEKPTPWPCFCVTASKFLIDNNPNALKALLLGIRESCQLFVNAPNNLELISKTSKLSIEDSKKWFNETTFSETGELSQKTLEDTIQILRQTKIVKNPISVNQIVSSTVATMKP